jgi:hypothetical protein
VADLCKDQSSKASGVIARVNTQVDAESEYHHPPSDLRRPATVADPVGNVRGDHHADGGGTVRGESGDLGSRTLETVLAGKSGQEGRERSASDLLTDILQCGYRLLAGH